MSNIRFKIRFDNTIGNASVIDIIRLVTGKDSFAASKKFHRLSDEHRGRCSTIRINGTGRKTPVADLDLLEEIIWEIQANVSIDFRKQVVQGLHGIFQKQRPFILYRPSSCMYSLREIIPEADFYSDEIAESEQTDPLTLAPEHLAGLWKMHFLLKNASKCRN